MLFKTPPPDFKKEVDVVGCYVQHGGKFVLLRHVPPKRAAGLWGIPAGKVNQDEPHEAAMVRELKEETGLVVSPRQLTSFDSIFVRHEFLEFEYHMFSLMLDARPEITIDPLEHDEMRWVTPEESLTMPLVPDQDECIRMFFKL